MGLIALLVQAAAVCPMSGRKGSGCPFAKHHRRLESSAGLLNEGKACWGHCNSTAGSCPYCGTGQCCRRKDYDLSVPGCELASFGEGKLENITGARCGDWEGDPNAIGLKNKGKACMGHCGAPGGGCAFCGTGQSAPGSAVGPGMRTVAFPAAN